MSQQTLHSVQGTPFLSSFRRPVKILKLLPQRPGLHISNRAKLQKDCLVGVRASPQGGSVIESYTGNAAKNKAFACDQDESSDALPYVQTLRTFPKEELLGKVVMVRFDSKVLLQEDRHRRSQLFTKAFFTIRYLLEAGARVVLVSDWNNKVGPRFHNLESCAEYLSSVLNHKVAPAACFPAIVEGLENTEALLCENLSRLKGEASNSSKLAELLSSGVDVFVNDSFSQSHKMLASTVAITRFCNASLAGFHFEESLFRLRNASETDNQPYIAIIGGAHLRDKASALRFLASVCDGLVFVGMMSFQIMHALDLPVTSNLLEQDALEVALDLIQIARDRGIHVLCPKDFWCTNDQIPRQIEIFPAHGIPEG